MRTMIDDYDLAERLIEEMDGCDWSDFLRGNPLYADRCDWEKLNGEDWVRLLVVQPQFADNCSWEKLDQENWDDLLKAQPQFAKWREAAAK